MKVTMLIRPEATAQPRSVAGISKSKTIDVKSLPRCEADRVTRYRNDYGRADFRCEMRARYDIDGVKMCPRHAGEVALAECLASGPETES